MEDEDDELTTELFNSKQFKELFQKAVEKDTWDKGLPKVYMNEDGWLVHHYKDGKVDLIKKIR